MSMDPSLKSGASLKRHRNVLTRTERIERLMEKDKFSIEKGDEPLGLPKVGNRKLISAGKKKKAAADDEE